MYLLNRFVFFKIFSIEVMCCIFVVFILLLFLIIFNVEGNMVIVIGVSIVGVVVLIFVVFFIICFFKSCKL